MKQREPLDALTLISTTRSVRRRLDLDRSVDLATVRECLEIALQAPNGGDEQAWRFVVVTDPGQRRRIGALYRRANADYAAGTRERADAGEVGAQRQLASSGVFWERLESVPVLVVAAFEPQSWFDPASSYSLASAYGSVFPAVWNFQLACRLHGLGTCLVTSHLKYPEEMAGILELPSRFRQVGMVAVGHLIGTDFRPAPRRPLDEVVRFGVWEAAPDQ